MSEFRRAKKRLTVSVGESVRVMRELQELRQDELAELTGILRSTLSAIENDRVRLGVERAKVLATALMCHPGVLAFPGWKTPEPRAPASVAEYEEFRRDHEDGGKWFSLQRYSNWTFSSSEEALLQSRMNVEWLA